MDESEKREILDRAKEWMRTEINEKHLENTKKLADPDKFKINPFLWAYLSNYYKGNTDYRTLAEVLFLPRALGTSINTSFGSAIQKFISTVFSDEDFGSVVSGIDIEFTDAVDGRKKYCQIKAGPNSLNRDDVTTIRQHFQAVKNLAKQNNLPLQFDDLVLGVIYGEHEDMNANIKSVADEFTLYAGKEFWYRFTGDETFYEDLALAMGEVAKEVDARKTIEETLDKLAENIAKKYPEMSESEKSQQ